MPTAISKLTPEEFNKIRSDACQHIADTLRKSLEATLSYECACYCPVSRLISMAAETIVRGEKELKVMANYTMKHVMLTAYNAGKDKEENDTLNTPH